MDTEGISGAMIYSQNCFASLERQFSWVELDQCDAFDSLMLTAAASGLSDVFTAENEYFGRSPSEGRYSKAMMLSGAASKAADLHHSQVQAAASAYVAVLAAAGSADALETQEGSPLEANVASGAAHDWATSEVEDASLAEEPIPLEGESGE